MDKNRKKELLLQYKERKVIGGVYVIRNKENGKMLLLSALDLNGSKNRFEFSKQTGSCSYIKLQSDWNKLGWDMFEFEVLEKIEKKPEQTDGEFKEDVKLLEEMHLSKISKDSLY